jgi:hypothetical protein
MHTKGLILVRKLAYIQDSNAASSFRVVVLFHSKGPFVKWTGSTSGMELKRNLRTLRPNFHF